MIDLNFKNWIKNEIATSTSCIAMFARPILPVITRIAVKPKSKKKKKK